MKALFLSFRRPDYVQNEECNGETREKKELKYFPFSFARCSFYFNFEENFGIQVPKGSHLREVFAVLLFRP
jgi:hypothetical protein